MNEEAVTGYESNVPVERGDGRTAETAGEETKGLWERGTAGLFEDMALSGSSHKVLSIYQLRVLYPYWKMGADAAAMLHGEAQAATKKGKKMRCEIAGSVTIRGSALGDGVSKRTVRKTEQMLSRLWQWETLLPGLCEIPPIRPWFVTGQRKLGQRFKPTRLIQLLD